MQVAFSAQGKRVSLSICAGTKDPGKARKEFIHLVTHFSGQTGTVTERRLVGRDRELEHITTIIERAAGEQPAVVLISGDAGFGKTTLLREALGRATARGFAAVMLESVTGDRLSGDYMVVNELQMGPVGLKDLAIVFADAHIFKQLKLDKKPALLLGMKAFR